MTTNRGELLYRKSTEARGTWAEVTSLWEEPPLDPAEAALLQTKRPPRFDIPSRRPQTPDDPDNGRSGRQDASGAPLADRPETP
jgi:hypothetical protein